MIALRAFLSWWLAELAGLLPVRAAPSVVAVALGPDGTLAAELHRPGRAPTPLLPPGSTQAALVALLPGVPARHLAVGLPQALTRSVTLPLAAASRLAEVLALDMDRQSPFRAEEVVFHARVLVRDRAARLLRAHLALAPRAAIAEATALAARLGLALHYAGPCAAPPWDDDLKPGGGARPTRLAGALAGLAVVLLLAATVVPGLRAEAHVAALERQLAAARAEAAATLAAREAAEAAAAPLALLHGLGPPATALVAALSDALPDDAVLRRLVLREGRLEITGSSAGAAELVRRLSTSLDFAQVEYRSPVVPAGGGREQFHLALSPRNGGAP
jgi:general secretion pathway protein L